LESIEYDAISLTNFTPLPGSAIGQNPEKFGCKIIDTNIDHYNRCIWGPGGPNQQESLISLHNMSIEDLQENINRMRDYVVSINKLNKG